MHSSFIVACCTVIAVVILGSIDCNFEEKKCLTGFLLLSLVARTFPFSV